MPVILLTAEALTVCSLLLQERREIEAALHDGQLWAVAATNALELGVDVGSLDVTLHLGFPGMHSMQPCTDRKQVHTWLHVGSLNVTLGSPGMYSLIITIITQSKLHVPWDAQL